MAEAGGFEPPMPLRAYRISSAAHSTTLARFQPKLYLIIALKKRVKRGEELIAGNGDGVHLARATFFKGLGCRTKSGAGSDNIV